MKPKAINRAVIGAALGAGALMLYGRAALGVPSPKVVLGSLALGAALGVASTGVF